MYIIICYVAYLAVSLAVTIWVAQTLHRNGRSFLIDAFQGNRELADSVNHLLVVGFYLINFGYCPRAANGRPGAYRPERHRTGLRQAWHRLDRAGCDALFQPLCF